MAEEEETVWGDFFPSLSLRKASVRNEKSLRLQTAVFPKWSLVLCEPIRARLWALPLLLWAGAKSTPSNDETHFVYSGGEKRRGGGAFVISFMSLMLFSGRHQNNMKLRAGNPVRIRSLEKWELEISRLDIYSKTNCNFTTGYKGNYR